MKDYRYRAYCKALSSLKKNLSMLIHTKRQNLMPLKIFPSLNFWILFKTYSGSENWIHLSCPFVTKWTISKTIWNLLIYARKIAWICYEYICNALVYRLTTSLRLTNAYCKPWKQLCKSGINCYFQWQMFSFC